MRTNSQYYKCFYLFYFISIVEYIFFEKGPKKKTNEKKIKDLNKIAANKGGFKPPPNNNY